MNDGKPAAAYIFAVLVENIRLLFPQALGIHPFAFGGYPRYLIARCCAIKKLGALLVSAALCAGMAAPAFAFEVEAAPVEQPVLPEVVEEDVVTITDETSGALTPEGNLTLVDDYHTDYSDGSGDRKSVV